MAKERKPTGIKQVLAMFRKLKAKLFHTSDDKVYAYVPVAKHWETHPIRSSKMERWLRMKCNQLLKRAIKKDNVSEVIAHLESEGSYSSTEQKVWVRTARDLQSLYFDLADENWRVVRLHNGKWEILPSSSVFFVRPAGLLPVPEPQRDGDARLLRRFINVATEEDFLLILAFIAWAMRSGGPYPVLLFLGSHGSGKSTNARRIQAITDPSEADLPGTPRSLDDLMIAAKNSWLILLDNVSNIREWLSDGLARTATGAGQRKRELYTNDEESIIKVKRPVVITAIDPVIKRADLESRAITIHVPPISDSERREEEDLDAEFKGELPLILGGFLNLLAQAQHLLPTIKLEKKSRMADFERFGEAIACVLSYTQGRFQKAMRANRMVAKQTRLEESPLVWAIHQLIERTGYFSDTATELLADLNEKMRGTPKGDRWPHQPNQLSRQLRELMPDGESVGLSLDHKESHGKAIWTIRSTRANGSAPSAPSPKFKDSDADGIDL